MRSVPLRWWAACDCGRRPHLVGADAILWDAFVKSKLNRYELFAFDVRVGRGQSPLGGESAQMLAMWKALTQKRIDVVAWDKASVDIYEVKLYAGLGALGQVMSYRALWAASYPDLVLADVWLMFERIDADAAEVAALHGIRLIGREEFSGPLEYPSTTHSSRIPSLPTMVPG